MKNRNVLIIQIIVAVIIIAGAFGTAIYFKNRKEKSNNTNSSTSSQILENKNVRIDKIDDASNYYINDKNKFKVKPHQIGM